MPRHRATPEGDVPFTEAEEAEADAREAVFLQERALANLHAYYGNYRQQPITVDFGSIEAIDDAEVSHGAAGIQTLQMRDTVENPDHKNWMAILTGANTRLLGGQGASIVRMKTTANVRVQTTAAQVAYVLGMVLVLQDAIHTRWGYFKKLLEDGADPETLDITDGWPPLNITVA